MRLYVTAFLAMVLEACGPSAGQSDSGTLAADAGTRFDAGTAASDAGPTDAGQPDSGQQVLDAGRPDGGAPDASMTDAGARDAGEPEDAGPVDAGESDAGSSDAGEIEWNDAGMVTTTCSTGSGGGLLPCSGTQVANLSGSCVNPSYTDNGNGTVTDNVTGLVWQQNAIVMGFTVQGGLDACAGLSINGVTGWRLPCVKELISIDEGAGGLDRSFQGADGTYWAGSPSSQTGESYEVSYLPNSGFIGIQYSYLSGNFIRCVQ